MTQFLELPYHGHAMSVPIDDQVTLQHSGPAPATQPVGDVVSRVLAAVRQPEGFLPLTDMLVPGDHVAIALQTGVPQAAEVVGAVLQAIRPCEPGKVEVVISETMDAASREQLRAALPGNVLLTVHRLGDRSALRYLAADEQAEAIRLSSSVVDADFVLPINVMRVSDPLTGGPSSDALFPGLIDDRQTQRLQRSVLQQIAKLDEVDNRWAADQAEQVRWALGVQLMLAVEIDRQGRAGRVIASTPESLATAIEQHVATQYAGAIGTVADVVIACVEGDVAQQNMENLARAALAARGFASTSGVIVLVTDLQQLQFGQRSDAAWEPAEPSAETEIDGQPNDESASTAAGFAGKLLGDLLNQIDASRRYLLWSDCDAEQVEAFGFGVLRDATVLERLIHQAGNCHIIRVAQTAPLC